MLYKHIIVLLIVYLTYIMDVIVFLLDVVSYISYISSSITRTVYYYNKNTSGLNNKNTVWFL